MKAIDLKKTVKGILLSLVISLVLMVILSLAVFFSDISEENAASLVFVLTAVSVAVGAFLLARNVESRGLLYGLCLSAGYFAVLFLLSILINGGVALSVNNLLRFVIILLSGMLGGAVGINTKKT